MGILTGVTKATAMPDRPRLFDPGARTRSTRHERIWATWEIVYTFVDFVAAATFIMGSIMFLSEAWTRTGTWMFVFGSFCFALKPTIRLLREIHLLRIGDVADLAEKLK